MPYSLTTTAFEYRKSIPSSLTCKVDDVSLPLKWENEPKGTVSFDLIMKDSDASVEKHPDDKTDPGGLEQVLWQDHDIQDSELTEFADDLKTNQVKKIIRKGKDPKIDSYSGFLIISTNGIPYCMIICRTVM